jgi:hypothetical protein
VTEYGYSALAAQPEVTIEGALLNADFAAQFLTLGGTAAYLYSYEPNYLDKEPDCNSWGDNMMFKADESHGIEDHLATYWGARLLTQDWIQPGAGAHGAYQASFRARGGQRATLTAYAVHRPDGRWALLVLNKDPRRAWNFDVRFSDETGRVTSGFTGPVTRFQFGSGQYVWSADGDQGHASRSDPPAETHLSGTQAFSAPPASISVLVGAGPQA